MSTFKNLAYAATAALTLAGSTAALTSAADARPFHEGGFHRSVGWHGGYHRGYRRFGLGFGTGLALGALSNHYGDCYVQRRLVRGYNGHAFYRPVRVCV